MEFSADYPGALAKLVEAETGALCLFLARRGRRHVAESAGRNPRADAFGNRFGEAVLKLSSEVKIDGEGH